MIVKSKSKQKQRKVKKKMNGARISRVGVYSIVKVVWGQFLVVKNGFKKFLNYVQICEFKK
jgi:hypothetical protein